MVNVPPVIIVIEPFIPSVVLEKENDVDTWQEDVLVGPHEGAASTLEAKRKKPAMKRINVAIFFIII